MTDITAGGQQETNNNEVLRGSIQAGEAAWRFFLNSVQHKEHGVNTTLNLVHDDLVYDNRIPTPQHKHNMAKPAGTGNDNAQQPTCMS